MNRLISPVCILWAAAAVSGCQQIDHGTTDVTVTHYNSVTNPGYFTYPGYALNGPTYSCPGSSQPGYVPQQINLYMPNLPQGGTVPLLLFFPGTYDNLDLDQLTSGISNSLAMRAAQLGFAAASVAYLSSDGAIAELYPDRLDAKSRCVFNSDISASSGAVPTDNSAIAQLCGNVGPLAQSKTQVDCAKGIFATGHSQGGEMALIARNFEPRVVAAYTLGTGATYDAAHLNTFEDPNLMFCYLADPTVVMAKKGSLGCPYGGSPGFSGTMGSANYRALPSTQIRAEAGDVDPYFADIDAPGVTVDMVSTRLNGLFNGNCPAVAGTACGVTSGGGSGWFLIGSSQLTPCAPNTACTAITPTSHAGHCFFSNGNSVGCANGDGLTELYDPDPQFFQTGQDAPGWALDANLLWLKAQATP